MNFLTTTDLQAQVRSQVLGLITANNTTALDLAEEMAISEVRSYLAGRYDVDAIYAATGTARSATIIMYTIDVLMYHLHTQSSPNDVPEVRIRRYEAAIKWLTQCAKGLLNPDLPIAKDDDGEDILGNLRLGGPTKKSTTW